MTKRPRRNHSPAFKAKVALAALKGDSTMSELATQFDLNPNQIKQWKDQLLDGVSDVFDDKRKGSREPEIGTVAVLCRSFGSIYRNKGN